MNERKTPAPRAPLRGNGTDFIQQVVRGFRTSDTYLMRGWATTGGWTGPVLRLSYRGGPDSILSEVAEHQLGRTIKLWLKGRDRAAPELFAVPYNPTTGRYNLELWGYPGNDMHAQLDEKGSATLERGELLFRLDLLPGAFADAATVGRPLTDVATESVMHPVLPLPIELARCDVTQRIWDNRGGANYRCKFSMDLRGRDHFLGAGAEAYPYGGLGGAHHRTLFSGYAPDSGPRELGEMRVKQIEWLVLKNDCAVGLHRHRANQEPQLLLKGEGLMVVGDWCQMPSRHRCVE